MVCAGAQLDWVRQEHLAKQTVAVAQIPGNQLHCRSLDLSKITSACWCRGICRPSSVEFLFMTWTASHDNMGSWCIWDQEMFAERPENRPKLSGVKRSGTGNYEMGTLSGQQHRTNSRTTNTFLILLISVHWHIFPRLPGTQCYHSVGALVSDSV